MRTSVSAHFGLEFPIFGFSHCRDVVAAVSRSGGMGVLGAALITPEQLELDLKWLDEQTGGRPYGVDVVMPRGYVKPDAPAATPDKDTAAARYRAMIPEEHVAFVDDLLDRLGVPPLPDSVAGPSLEPGWNADVAREHIEVAFRHPYRFLVNALGPPPPDIIEQAHANGVLVGALAGKPEHARRHVDEGVDVVICQGAEAGGHTGDIGTMVLVPDVVDAVGPSVPVLAAGGIASGRQIAAALALGAQGAWMGSVWLTTTESDVDPGVVARYLAATSADTMRTPENSGKPSRGLRTPWRQAWQADDAPPILRMPLQGILTAEAKERIKHARRYDLMHASVGQVVGRMNRVLGVADVIHQMVEEYIATMERLNGLQN
jgi:NAD(P)H-dependent flavin oxidoreductase YrpB (nitropropane dioxygenase family)